MGTVKEENGIVNKGMDKAKIQHLYRQFIVLPAKLVLANSSILVIFVVVLFLNKLTPSTLKVNPTSPKWIFETMPSEALSLVLSPWFVLVVGSLYIVKSFLIIVIGSDLMAIFTRKRKSLWQSVLSIKMNQVVWFFKFEILLHLVFLAIGLVFYSIALLLYSKLSLGYIALAFLVGSFALLYPAFYFGLSIASTLSVLPLTDKEKYQKLKVFLVGKNSFYTYLFYAGRLAVEYSFLIILPALALYLTQSKALAGVLVIIGLVLPLFILRSSSYQFKLKILSQDADIKRIFEKHFQEQ